MSAILNGGFSIHIRLFYIQAALVDVSDTEWRQVNALLDIAAIQQHSLMSAILNGGPC